MKKAVSLVLTVACLILYCVGVASADMDVKLIGGPITPRTPASLDDFKLNAETEIDGYGMLIGTKFEFWDRIYRWGEYAYKSGADADYAVLLMDITNYSLNEKDFLADCQVVVTFDELYVYEGFASQRDYNRDKDCVIDKDDQFAIKPMYEGHYLFGCTLPNAVVNSKKPLKMVITIDGNEITYNVRK